MPPAKKGVGIREVRVGLLVVVAIAVLIFLILNASGDISPFSTKLHLKARFQNADGLRRGSEVRLAGVRIGKVDDVRLLPPSDDPNAPQVESTFPDLRVGLLVVVAIAVLIFLILNASGDISPFSTKLHLKARFQNADGLRRGSEVRLAGVRIGKVDDVRLLPPSDDPNAPQVESTF